VNGLKSILWYGVAPQPGIRAKLDTRGFRLLEEPSDDLIGDAQLAATTVVVLNHASNTVDRDLKGYRHLPKFIDHGILVLIVVPTIDDFSRAREAHLYKVNRAFPWDKAVLFLTDLKGNNFDNIVSAPPAAKWHSCEIKQLGDFEPLTDEEKLLVCRAFGKAEEVHIRALKSGFTRSRVFMAHEKRRESSIAHWTQPRLIKIGWRADLEEEVGNMKAVSPFVPFELRPNLEVYIEGFRKSVFIADFVDRSESLIDVARAGRAETAISNLFNRTLHRWRERAWSCGMADESLAVAAERLKMFKPGDVCSVYLESVVCKGINVESLWESLKKITFRHRAATIHADLHGDNVRVRGDDAILIDLGSVKGTDSHGGGAPLSFDVAMLEVALIFTCSDEELEELSFQQREWENEIRPYYKLDAILSTPARDAVPQPDSWMFGCIHRVRAFGIYDQSNSYEYAIALAIAMLRWCKFEPQGDADKGRRVVALHIVAELIAEIEGKKAKSS
jgi:hypothetical protein